jgi:iron(II)-dependent oxidoreductase
MPKKRNTETDISQVQVKLKPIFGIAPGTYLTFIYTLILLGVLFLLLIFPGLKHRGTYVSIQSFPPAAVVTVDGDYAGSTPCTVLVPPGLHTLRLEKPFFRSRDIEETFGGRVFGTLFVKPRRQITADMEVQDIAALLDFALRDFAANPHIPEILTHTVQAGYDTPGPGSRQPYYEFLDNAKFFITNSLQLSRLISAAASLAAGGGVLTPGGLIELATAWTIQLDRFDSTTFWLLLSLPENISRTLTGSEWFERYLSRYQAVAGQAVPASPRAGASLTVRGLRFLPVPAGRMLQGEADSDVLTPLLAHPVDLPGFYMAETEVTNSLYQQFVEAEPRWRKSNLNALLTEGVVSESYLSGWEDDRYPAGEAALPVVQISYYAAEAFCDWLTASGALPPGTAAQLPYESEWEYAARGGLSALPYPAGRDPGVSVFYSEDASGPQDVGASEANGYGLKDMSGNVWEWCADWFSPVRYFFTSWNAAENRPGAGGPSAGFERVVRGGSWANRAELVKIHTRASQPGAWCTPYLGFRPVLVRP